MVIPLVIMQVAGGRFPHALEAALQYRPVVAIQSEVPHEQGIALTELPSVVVHGAAFLQEFMDAVQNKPVEGPVAVEDVVQSLVPHWQSVPAVLVVIPLVKMQVAGGRSEHVSVEETQ